MRTSVATDDSRGPSVARSGRNAAVSHGRLNTLFCAWFFLAGCIECSRARPVDRTTQTSPPSARAQVASTTFGPPLSYDEAHAGIVRSVSGYAGLYFRGDTLVLMLVDTTRRAAAEAAVQSRLERRPYRSVEVRKARYDYRRLLDWKLLVRRNWSRGMTMVGVDPVRNVVIVGTRDPRSIPRIRRRLEALGIPADALVVEDLGVAVPV